MTPRNAIRSVFPREFGLTSAPGVRCRLRSDPRGGPFVKVDEKDGGLWVNVERQIDPARSWEWTPDAALVPAHILLDELTHSPMLAMPDELSDKGQAAWRTIMRLWTEPAHAECAINPKRWEACACGVAWTHTGGCRAFAAPDPEKYPHADKAELVVVYDGSDVRHYFEVDGVDAEDMQATLKRAGFASESGTNTYSGIYPLRTS